MRYLVLVLACMLLALPADAGRRRNSSKPIVVYFPVQFGADGLPTRAGATYSVQIPMNNGWATVATVGQGECLRYDQKLTGGAPPYWVRVCWSDDETMCSDAGIECDPNDPQWSLRGVAPGDACTERACLSIR